MELTLQRFMQEHNNWKEILQSPPYSLNIKEDNGYVLLKYDQVNSDFAQPLVQEARGIIFDAATLRPVCIPFFKFFNYGEQYAAKLDWGTAKVTEKIDGSLVKLWFDKGVWHWSTNGVINAATAEVKQNALNSEEQLTFLDLIKQADNYNQIDYSKLSTNYTYMFELVSPKNQIVLYYAETSLYFLGARDNNTLDELDLDIGIKKPKLYNLSNLGECIAATLSDIFAGKEGVVAKDQYNNRIKIKTEDYFAKHKLANNGNISYSALLDLIKQNDYEEFLCYFPQYKALVDKLINAIDILSAEIGAECAKAALKKADNYSRKDLALYMKENSFKYQDYVFKALFYTDKIITPIEHIFSIPNNKLIPILREIIAAAPKYVWVK